MTADEEYGVTIDATAQPPADRARVDVIVDAINSSPIYSIAIEKAVIGLYGKQYANEQRTIIDREILFGIFNLGLDMPTSAARVVRLLDQHDNRTETP